MKNPIIWFDSLLIERIFEPIAWRVEYRFSKTNFWLARVVMLAKFFCDFLQYSMFATLGSPMNWPSIAISFLVVTMLCVNTFLLERSSSGKDMANPLRISPAWIGLRIVATAYLIYALIFIWLPLMVRIITYGPEFYGFLIPIGLAVVGSVVWPLHFYFLACSSAPPWWKEARDEKLAEKMVLQAT